MTTPLFDDLPPGTRTRTYARGSALPGPSGKKCKHCEHAIGTRHGKKVYYKCAIARRAATSGPGTDIRLNDPACSRFEETRAP